VATSRSIAGLLAQSCFPDGTGIIQTSGRSRIRAESDSLAVGAA
jgi:hypothetical protein